MKDTTWRKRIKRLMKEAEMPFYPDVPEIVSQSPVTMDAEAIKGLLTWAIGSTAEEIDRAVSKIKSISSSGAVIDNNSLADITSSGDYQTPVASVPPVSVTAATQAPVVQEPIAAPEVAPVDSGATLSPSTASSFASGSVEPESDDLGAEEDLEDVDVEDEEGQMVSPEDIGDEFSSDEEEIEVPSASGEEEEEEEEEDMEETVKKNFFKSFFN